MIRGANHFQFDDDGGIPGGPNAPVMESWALCISTAVGAAIMGDLSEMAQTRGRLWFIAAYSARCSPSPGAFVARAVRRRRRPPADLRPLPSLPRPHACCLAGATGSWLDLLNSSGPLLACIMSWTLWFALFFALVHMAAATAFQRFRSPRWSPRDRLRRLPRDPLDLARRRRGHARTFTCAAFLSARWRKPFEAWPRQALSARYQHRAAFTILSRQFLAQTSGHFPQLSQSPGRASYALVFSFQGSLLLVAIVCSRLHTLLLEPPVAKESAAEQVGQPSFAP